jgi:hypothetical protein
VEDPLSQATTNMRRHVTCDSSESLAKSAPKPPVATITCTTTTQRWLQ